MKIAKQDIANSLFVLAKKGDIKNQAAANRIVNDIFNIIACELADGKPVCITGLFTFIPIERAAKTGRNPRTGEKLEIEAKSTIRLKVSGKFKDELNS